jgi:hypothetical protein
MFDALIALAFFSACAPLQHRFIPSDRLFDNDYPVNRAVRSVEKCRIQLFKCYYDDNNGFVPCIRSWNRGTSDSKESGG